MSKKLAAYLLALATASSEPSYPIPKPAYRATKAETKKCKSCKFFRAIINGYAFCANTGAQTFPLNSVCEQYIKKRK